MIREMKNEDMRDILEIWLDSNKKAHPFIPGLYWENNLSTVREMIPEAEVYVYEKLRKSVGFVGIDHSYIAGLFVQDKMQGKGIGSMLLGKCKETYHHLSLHVYEKNERAVKFYLREGFTVRLAQREERTGETEYLMEWDYFS